MYDYSCQLINWLCRMTTWQISPFVYLLPICAGSFPYPYKAGMDTEEIRRAYGADAERLLGILAFITLIMRIQNLLF